MLESQPLHFEVFLGILVLLAGILSVGWGWRLWRNPDSLKPTSLMSRFFLADWQAGPRSQSSKASGLNEKRVKYYAIRTIVGGVFGILAGLILVF